MAFKYGAWDYVEKPFAIHEVFLHLARAIQYRKEKEKSNTPVPLKRADIIGTSSQIHGCLELVARASVTDASVLITGERGTGRELFERAIHENSNRCSGNFMTVDCGALPETLAEKILFGHEKGAFTGADSRRDGLVMQAKDGTLFLYEIGDMPMSVQKKLLRALQEKRVLPLGAKQDVAVNFRLVSVTNHDLVGLVKEKKFREDLYFRISAL